MTQCSFRQDLSRSLKWVAVMSPCLAGSISWYSSAFQGAGNTIFPLLDTNQNPDLSIIACDFSPRAVKLVQVREISGFHGSQFYPRLFQQSHSLYSSPPAGRISAAVWDITSACLPPNVAPSSVDFILMIFVLSALHPNEWRQAIANLYTVSVLFRPSLWLSIRQVLKPGGRILLRDYGRYDLAQLRFKEGRLLEDNFYIRGDKTRVYFFSLGKSTVSLEPSYWLKWRWFGQYFHGLSHVRFDTGEDHNHHYRK